MITKAFFRYLNRKLLIDKATSIISNTLLLHFACHKFISWHYDYMNRDSIASLCNLKSSSFFKKFTCSHILVILLAISILIDYNT